MYMENESMSLVDSDGDIIYYGGREFLEDALISPENRLYVFRKEKLTGVIEKTNIFPNKKHIPDIGCVIENLGYEVYAFNDMIALYRDLFENDDRFLPFDTDELHYAKDNVYVGFCHRDDVSCNIEEYYYFYGIIKVKS